MKLCGSTLSDSDGSTSGLVGQHMTTLTRILTSAALVIVGVGCHSATTEDDPMVALGGGCSGIVDIQVSFAPTGKIPSFDWASRCGVALLRVQTVPPMGAAPMQLWALSAPESRPFKPVIVYGIVPQGATLLSGPGTLVQGVTYKVIVDQTLGQDASVARGERTFTLP